MASKPIATPLKTLDCCPVSDGGAAFILSRDRIGDPAVRVIGTGQAHTHQHVSAAPSLTRFGAVESVARARAACGVDPRDLDYAAIYDSFTITLTILLEEIGLSARGEAGARARAGYFDCDGKLPLIITPMVVCSPTVTVVSEVQWRTTSLRRTCR
jgi:acetyl-CoA acetyltransferase